MEAEEPQPDQERPSQHFGQARLSVVPPQQEVKPVYKFTYGEVTDNEVTSCDPPSEEESWPFPEVTTLYKAFKRNLFRNPNQDMMGTRDGWITYRMAADLAEHFSYGMLDLVTESEGLKLLGIMSKNRTESFIAHIANMYQSVASVVIPSAISDEQLKFILTHSDLISIACSCENILQLSSIKTQDPGIKLTNLICFDEVTEEQITQLEQAGLTLHIFHKIIEKGREVSLPILEPDTDGCFMIQYTQGVAADPKGVMVTHKMVMQTAMAVQKRLQDDKKVSQSDIIMLNLQTMLDFQGFAMGLIYSAKCAFGGNNKEEMQVLKPTMLFTVPYVLVGFFNEIQQSLKEQKGCTYWFIEKCVNSKLDNLERHGSTTHMIYDSVIFSKIRSITGGKMRLIFTGQDAISQEILNFMKICFCVEILQAYGMTESCSMSCLSMIGDNQQNIVGGPLQNVKIKLKDPGDSGQGEICLSGPNVAKSYFKGAIEADWVSTGDLGEILPNGAIKIIDKVENQFKLTQGEPIAPVKLENIYMQSEFVSQIFVYGEESKEYLVAIVILDKKYADRVLKQKKGPVANTPPTITVEPVVEGEAQPETPAEQTPVEESPPEVDYSEVLTDIKIKMTVFDDLLRLATFHNLKPEERLKNIILVMDDISSCLTFLHKLRRSQAKTLLQEKLDKLYADDPLTK